MDITAAFVEAFRLAIETIIPEVVNILLLTIVKSCVAAEAVVKPVHVVASTLLFKVTVTVAEAVDAVSGVTEIKPGVVAPEAKEIPPVPDCNTNEADVLKDPIVTEPVVKLPAIVTEPVVIPVPIAIVEFIPPVIENACPVTTDIASPAPEAIVIKPEVADPILTT
jgi:hypothetical protein